MTRRLEEIVAEANRLFSERVSDSAFQQGAGTHYTASAMRHAFVRGAKFALSGKSVENDNAA